MYICSSFNALLLGQNKYRRTGIISFPILKRLDLRQLTINYHRTLFYLEICFSIGLLWTICIRIIEIKRRWHSHMVPFLLSQTLNTIYNLHHINDYTWMSNAHYYPQLVWHIIIFCFRIYIIIHMKCLKCQTNILFSRCFPFFFIRFLVHWIWLFLVNHSKFCFFVVVALP